MCVGVLNSREKKLQRYKKGREYIKNLKRNTTDIGKRKFSRNKILDTVNKIEEK